MSEEINDEMLAGLTDDGEEKAKPAAKKGAAKKDKVLEKEEKAQEKDERFIIIVDEVENMPNFEVVGVNGVIYQIRRGKEVEVPRAVVKVLETAIAHRAVKTRDPVTGREGIRYQPYSAIPYRVIRKA